MARNDGIDRTFARNQEGTQTSRTSYLQLVIL